MSKTSIRTFTLLIWAFRSPLGLPCSNSLTERFNIIFAELRISLLHEGSTAGNTGNRCSESPSKILYIIIIINIIIIILTLIKIYKLQYYLQCWSVCSNDNKMLTLSSARCTTRATLDLERNNFFFLKKKNMFPLTNKIS
jgi:hypothetical protein